jgi:TPR repeat protein
VAPKQDPAPPAKPPAARVEPSTPPPHPVSTVVSSNDPAQLFASGQKYLYGEGVPRDCDRAQRDLRTAAAHSYPEAESLLATMYASGHCLGRDLPAAYRWYARALRHEPGNSRISSDLEVLWNQMTVAERKAAQSSGQ